MADRSSGAELDNDWQIEPLADFTLGPRVLLIVAIAVPLGVVSGVLSLILLRLIAFFTNLFFFGRLDLSEARPADSALGPWMILVPVVGATLVALMARYGSERIRGHGIPEALEAILINRARVEPKVALLKPVSAAISIGSGGPFGAEGPIIMTGGSFGSLTAQLFHLTSAERKTLLVAGAAGGMSATFASPFAAILLAVELLLFEWKPRSLIPVAVASLTALVVRRELLGAGPIFPVEHAPDLSVLGLLACVFIGLSGGGLAVVLSSLVYTSEDLFSKLPMHWVFWPPIGGLAVGIGGYLFPRALGVGYETIDELLTEDLALTTIVGVLVVKSMIWSISLGSGTSGGVLAPLLMVGAAFGALAAHVLPDNGVGYWALLSMAAVLGGSMRAPLTASVFAVEVTHDYDMIAPLLAATIPSYAFTALLMKRSILTEKISRRGLHLSHEYAIDPLELHFVRDVMSRDLVVLPSAPTRAEVLDALQSPHDLFPVRNAHGDIDSVLTRAQLESGSDGSGVLVGEAPAYVYAGDTLRSAVRRMARTGKTRLLVREDGDELAGVIALSDLLKAYEKNTHAEEQRERVLAPSWRRG